MRALFTHGHATSRPECALYSILTATFGETGVRRQMRVGRWTVDFFVEPANAYVEVDGTYWHGLDRTIEELSQSNTRIDRKILATRHSDAMQNSWFADNGLRLVRFTDKELKRMPRQTIIDRIKNSGA